MQKEPPLFFTTMVHQCDDLVYAYKLVFLAIHSIVLVHSCLDGQAKFWLILWVEKGQVNATASHLAWQVSPHIKAVTVIFLRFLKGKH